MSYAELLRILFQAGFTRIERDDRLLDIFPDEDREKGVELWERWNTETVHLVRVRLPYTMEKLELYELTRSKLAAALAANTRHHLSHSRCVARGEAVAHWI